MQIKRFRGLNNVTDPLRLGLGWLSRADNINISDTGAIARRDGFALTIAASPSGAFATEDGTRMYIVDSGSLKQISPSMTTTTLLAGLNANKPMQWEEVGNDVYYSNGEDVGIIRQDGSIDSWSWPMPTTPNIAAITGLCVAGTYQVVCTYLLPDGRETGAGEPATITLLDGEAIQLSDIPQVAGLSTQVYVAPADSEVFQHAFATTMTSATWNAGPDELGVDLMTNHLYSVPENATNPTLWGGRLYLFEYLPHQNVTVVWASEPLGFHLFDLSKAFLTVPGRGALLAPHDNALIIGTDTHIYAFDGEKLAILAPYGAVPGWSRAKDEDDGKILFWTSRGLCSALPFANLTHRQVSVAPGTQAGAAIIRENGAKRYVVTLTQGGTAHNPRA